jgi:hypothetical protein
MYMYIYSENGNFRLFAANVRQKWQTFVYLLQMETKTGSLFSLVANDK